MKLQVLVLILFFFLLSNISTVSGCHDNERAALLNFKSHLADPSNRLSSWQGQNCCTWHGVFCSDSFHVIALDLRNPNPSNSIINSNSQLISNSNSKSTALQGIVPSSLFSLTRIQYLDLSFNHFMFSRIPFEFSKLIRLTYLNLSNAVFKDSITTQFSNLTSLQKLDLSCSFPVADFSIISYNLSSELTVESGDEYRYLYGSSLVSSNLDWLQGLQNLVVLKLSGVDLSQASISTHQWASPISTLSNLRLLQLSNCKIFGTLPISPFLNLTYLSVLAMDFNPIISKIPVHFTNLTYLSFLQLNSLNLQGSIPYLPQLVALHLSNTNLTIDLKSMFEVSWPQLQVLDIRNTHVLGSIPPSIANKTSLVSFRASSCFIEGVIPPSVANLSRIEILDLAFNNLVGHLPQSISNMKSLRFLNLIQNYLEGTIPDSVCNISSLYYLALGNNHLSGNLPDCFSHLSNLEVLHVSLNYLSGTIQTSKSLFQSSNPYIIGFSFNNLTLEQDNQQPLPLNFQPQILDLSSCNIQGKILNFLFNLTKLRYLSLAYNKLSGSIPSWLFNLPQLGYLDLSFNNLEGSLPPFIKFNSFFGPTTLSLAKNLLQGQVPSQFDNIDVINLSGNNFTGRIPEQARLENVRFLSLASNRLFGQIPSSLCHENSILMLLDLSKNSLSGQLTSSLGNCTFLNFLNIAQNNLSGSVPEALENAKNMSYLDLTGNHFEGRFPIFIQKFKDLEVLKMGYNKFAGKIPPFIGELKKLKILVLKSNFFNESIPEEINKLGKLQIMDFSNNKLSGLIPEKLRGLRTLLTRPTDGDLLGYVVSFTYAGVELNMAYKGLTYQFEKVRTFLSGIDLSLNALTGCIPQEITLLKGLAMLNLSHNALFGEIPNNIGDMSGLESLDFSFNNLSGEIPASINMLDALGVMNLSYNNLSGKIPPGTRFDTLYGDGSNYLGNKYLCSGANLINCDETSSSGSDKENTTSVEDDARERLLFIGVVIFGYGVGFWGYFVVMHLITK